MVLALDFLVLNPFLAVLLMVSAGMLYVQIYIAKHQLTLHHITFKGWCGSTDAYCGSGTFPEYAFGGKLPDGRSSSSSSASNWASFTHYDPSTGPAYCNGVYYSSGSLVVAMSTNLLNNNNACGRQIVISANGNSAVATVVDMCNEYGGTPQL